MALPRPIIIPVGGGNREKDKGKGRNRLSVGGNEWQGQKEEIKGTFLLRPWRVNRWCKIPYGARSNFSRWSLMRASSDKQVMPEFMLVGRPQIQHHPIFKSANTQVRQFQTLNTRTIASADYIWRYQVLFNQVSACAFRRTVSWKDIGYNSQLHDRFIRSKYFSFFQQNIPIVSLIIVQISFCKRFYNQISD